MLYDFISFVCMMSCVGDDMCVIIRKLIVLSLSVCVRLICCLDMLVLV